MRNCTKSRKSAEKKPLRAQRKAGDIFRLAPPGYKEEVKKSWKKKWEENL